jgi:hypothetical protein
MIRRCLRSNMPSDIEKRVPSDPNRPQKDSNSSPTFPQRHRRRHTQFSEHPHPRMPAHVHRRGVLQPGCQQGPAKRLNVSTKQPGMSSQANSLLVKISASEVFLTVSEVSSQHPVNGQTLAEEARKEQTSHLALLDSVRFTPNSSSCAARTSHLHTDIGYLVIPAISNSTVLIPETFAGTRLGRRISF